VVHVRGLHLQSPPPHERFRVTRAFVDLFVSRALVYVGFYTLVGYLLFYVTEVLGVPAGAAAQRLAVGRLEGRHHPNVADVVAVALPLGVGPFLVGGEEAVGVDRAYVVLVVVVEGGGVTTATSLEPPGQAMTQMATSAAIAATPTSLLLFVWGNQARGPGALGETAGPDATAETVAPGVEIGLAAGGVPASDEDIPAAIG